MTPSWIGAAVLLLIAFLNLRLGRSILYPPAHFSLLWLALLIAALALSGTYFPLSLEAVAVFCVGVFAFSVGGALMLLITQRLPAAPRPLSTADSTSIQYFLGGGLVLLVAALPLFWRYVLSVVDPRFDNLWWGIRSGMIALAEVQGQKPWEQFMYDNLTVLAILLALTAVAHRTERAASQVVAGSLVVVATLYNLATGSRAGAFTVLLGSLGIIVIRRGRIMPRHIAVGIIAVAVMFVPVTVLRVRTGDVNKDLQVVSDIALLYTVGPLTAFDQYLQYPAVLSQPWSVSHSVLHAANRLGFEVDAPSQHLDYVNVGAPWGMNVYTMFLAYFAEFGWLGVVVFPALVGFATVYMYRLAAERGGHVLILYAMAFSEICKSGFSEGFFMGLNMWFKAALYCVVLYAVLPVRRKSPAALVERTSTPGVAAC
jgi:oligosaccharide repeat unit polymerase